MSILYPFQDIIAGRVFIPVFASSLNGNYSDSPTQFTTVLAMKKVIDDREKSGEFSYK